MKTPTNLAELKAAFTAQLDERLRGLADEELQAEIVALHDTAGAYKREFDRRKLKWKPPEGTA